MKPVAPEVRWLSPLPPLCQFGNVPFDPDARSEGRPVMYDANLPGIGWGNYCSITFHIRKGRVGMGFGQRYELFPSGDISPGPRWLKVEG